MKIKWVFSEVALPVLLVVVIYWPVGSVALRGVTYLYERIFGGGDILPICCALLLGLYDEAKPLESREDKTVPFGKFNVKVSTLADWILGFSRLGVIFVTTTYVACKISYLKYDFPSSQTTGVDTLLTSISTATLALTVLVVAACAFTKRISEKSQS